MINRDEALVNITWRGQNGDLPDPVAYDAPAQRVLAWVAEAIRTGGVPGVAADSRVDLRDFVVERYAATGNRAVNRIVVRPKTPFGAL